MRALSALALLLLAGLVAAPFVAAGLEAIGPHRLLAVAGYAPAAPFEPLPREGAVWVLLATGLDGARTQGFATARAWAPVLAPTALVCLAAALLPCLRARSDRTRWAARGLRLLLAVVALAGLVHGLGALARLADRVVREPILAPPEDDRAVADTVLGELRWVLAREGPDARIREAAEACDLGLAEALVAGARLGGRPLLPETEAALEAARSWWGQSNCVAADVPCLLPCTDRPCRTMAALLARFWLDLTSPGDLATLGCELLVEPEPNRVLVALSVVGLVLSAGSLVAPEVTLPLGTARAALKVGIRNGLLRPRLVAELRRILDEAVDGRVVLDALRRFDREAAIAAVRLDRLRPLVGAGEELVAIGSSSGYHAALLAARSVDELGELPLFRRVATSLGEDAAGAFALLGRNLPRAFRVYRAGDEVLRAARNAAAELAASLLALLLALLRAPADLLLRRALPGRS